MTFSKTAPTCKLKKNHLPSLTTVFLIRFFFLLSPGFLDFSSWTWFLGLTPRKLLQFLAPQWHFFFSFPDKIFRHIDSSLIFYYHHPPLKVAEHSFGSLWVYGLCQIMARERWQLTSWNLASEKYTDKRLWLAGKMWRFCSFHGNMNDWIQP